MRDEMVYVDPAGGSGEIGKIQTLAILTTFVAGPALLDASASPALSAAALRAGHRRRLQVAPMAVLNVFFYLDQRRIVLFLCVEFLLLNVLFTAATLWLGAALYGYGFTLAVLLTLASSARAAVPPAESPGYETSCCNKPQPW